MPLLTFSFLQTVSCFLLSSSQYDCKTDTGKCGFNPGFCKSLPAEFLVDHVRVYQNKADPNMTVGCNPRSHPTKRYITAHPEKFALPGAAHPLKKVMTGGGRCSADKECGQGQCSAKRCHCLADFTGPHCLVSVVVSLHVHSGECKSAG